MSCVPRSDAKFEAFFVNMLGYVSAKAATSLPGLYLDTEHYDTVGGRGMWSREWNPSHW
jgi:hypothetical protein